jgi:pyruvate,water dikinase
MEQTRLGDFTSPFAVPTPEGVEGWERMYPAYLQFSEDRREFEEDKLWFRDSMHYPEPMYPFDTLLPEDTWVILSQNTTKVFRVPSSKGLDHRIINGYVYVSPNTIEDGDEIARRAEVFAPRAGHYFENWDELYARWQEKAKDCRRRLAEIRFEPLPDVEDERAVFEADPLTTGHRLLVAYNRLLENQHEMAYLHFDMLGLGYGAFLTFRDFCHQAFPGIRDDTVAKMVAGIDILLFRPDDELRRLARLAVELGVGEHLAADRGPDAALEALRAAPRGEEWIAALEEAKDPWFWYSTGAGLTHPDRAWIDDLRIPFSVMAGYVQRLDAGEDIERPVDEVRRERDRITGEYRELLGTDEDRTSFDELLELARTVYPFVEDHNFYCEHQHYSLFWNKVRELGAVFAHHGFLDEEEDIFFLHRYEVHPALWDLQSGWATETPDRRDHWRRLVAERRRIMDAMRRWSPPPALGKVPEEVTESFTVMLWGITTETLARWQEAEHGGGDDGMLRGVAAAPGVAEGPARVIFSAAELEDVRPGEVLVCPITAPSWAPVFGRIAGAVSDIGGIMSHAAIVSREYGMPAVVGTGFGTTRIRTGQIVRIDGDRGTVEVLDGADG